MLGVVLFPRTSHERSISSPSASSPYPSSSFSHYSSHTVSDDANSRGGGHCVTSPSSRFLARFARANVARRSIGESAPHTDRRFSIPHSHVSTTRTRRCSHDWAACYAVRRSHDPPCKNRGSCQCEVFLHGESKLRSSTADERRFREFRRV
jgi:hypothetical protein